VVYGRVRDGTVVLRGALCIAPPPPCPSFGSRGGSLFHVCAHICASVPPRTHPSTRPAADLQAHPLSSFDDDESLPCSPMAALDRRLGQVLWGSAQVSRWEVRQGRTGTAGRERYRMQGGSGTAGREGVAPQRALWLPGRCPLQCPALPPSTALLLPASGVSRLAAAPCLLPLDRIHPHSTPSRPSQRFSISLSTSHTHTSVCPPGQGLAAVHGGPPHRHWLLPPPHLLRPASAGGASRMGGGAASPAHLSLTWVSQGITPHLLDPFCFARAPRPAAPPTTPPHPISKQQHNIPIPTAPHTC
jgi:hypothetical protein